MLCRVAKQSLEFDLGRAKPWDTDEMFQALAIPLLEHHGASGHTAKLLAQEQWGKGVEECKKQMTRKKRSGKSIWEKWMVKKAAHKEQG